jgi:hypothetical protein
MHSYLLSNQLRMSSTREIISLQRVYRGFYTRRSVKNRLQAIDDVFDAVFSDPTQLDHSLGIHRLSAEEKNQITTHFMTNVYPNIRNTIRTHLFQMPGFFMTTAVKMIQELIYCKYHTLAHNRAYHAFSFSDFANKIRPYLAEGLVANESCCGCGNRTMMLNNGSCTDAVCSVCNLHVEVKTASSNIYDSFKGGRVAGVRAHEHNQGAFCLFTSRGSGIAHTGDWSFRQNRHNVVGGVDKTTTTITVQTVTPLPRSYMVSVDQISAADVTCLSNALHCTFGILRQDTCASLIGSVYAQSRANPIPIVSLDVVKDCVVESMEEFHQMVHSQLPARRQIHSSKGGGASSRSLGTATGWKKRCPHCTFPSARCRCK